MFLASGALPPKPSTRGGLHKVAAAPPGPPRQHLIMSGIAAPLRYRGPTLWYKINKIIRLHTQRSPTWRLIVATPLLLNLLGNDSILDLVVSHLHHHTWRTIETEHNLSFSLVTTFFSISAGFWLVCIFSSLTVHLPILIVWNGTWVVYV